MEAAVSLAAGFGIRGRACLMTFPQSLMRMLPPPSRIIHSSLIVRPTTPCSLTATRTSTLSLGSSASHGSHPKRFLFHRSCLTSALNGTCQSARSPSLRTRRLNIERPSRNGCRILPITWSRPRSSMGNFCTLAWCCRPDVLTSPAWNASWVPLIKTPLFPTSLHVTPLLTFLGGSMCSVPRKSPVPSQAQPPSLMLVPSQTPAQVLASATSGAPGVSSQGGKQMEGTSDGLKQLALSFLLTLSAQSANLRQANTSGSLVTIEESSKAGGREGVEIGKPTRCSVASTASQILTNALLSHDMSPAVKTQLMAPREDSTHRLLISSQLSAFRTLSGSSSSISISDPPPIEPLSGPEPAPATLSPNLTQVTNRFRHGVPIGNVPAPVVSTIKKLVKPSAYSPGLSPLPSPLHPHCLARDRLRLWKPSPDVRSRHSATSENDDESVSRYARANKNKCKCAGVFDHQELSTNITISVVRALGLSVQSVRRGTSRHVLGKHEDATHHDHETLE